MINQNLQLELISVCRKIYPLPFTNFPDYGSTEEDILQFAKKNRLVHFFAIEVLRKRDCKNNKLWKDIVDEYKTYQKKVESSVKILKKEIGNKPLLVIKTVSLYPHITGDVDTVLIDQNTVSNVQEKFQQLKITFPITTDINAKISWTDTDEISHDFIWKNTIGNTIGNSKVLIPNPSLDVLLRLAHIPFELAEIRLGELLHIYQQAKRVDWGILAKEVNSMDWPKTFKKIVELINSLHYYLYQKPLTNEYDFQIIKDVSFPYRIPYSQLFQAVLEKKAWKKVWGARYLVKDRLGL